MSTIGPRFIEELRNRVSLSSVVGKRVKLTRRGNEYTGLCPFHKEKTPSFTVSEDKGFYHCFGCGAHGDAISFLMGIEKMSFTEAVESLAHSAGLEVPKASPAEAARFQKQISLYTIMEKACLFYQDQLKKNAGRKALEYLKSRGLNENDIQKFRLGYAPTGNLLRQHLLREGCAESDLIELGLVCKSTQKGADNYDYFRDRVLFSISDRRGHIIGFGGRVMGEGEPKYLNSPENELFHKGENLYALFQSLDTMRKTSSAVLVEGYMDVIALHKIGVTNAVAPLGTALTEKQIELMWKIAPEPTICFDGDGAGRRAADRACRRVLPILKPGYSLNFVFLPGGLDPDDFAKTYGKEPFEKLLKGAKPLSWLMWNRLIDGKEFNTPEKMALLEKDMIEMVNEIKDKTVRSYYEKELLAELKRFTKETLYNQKNAKNNAAKVSPIRLGTLPVLSPYINEAKMLLAYIIAYPETCANFLENLSFLKMKDKKITRLMDILTNELTENPEISGADLHTLLEQKYSQNIFIYLKNEMEMLARADKSPEQIRQDIQNRTRALQLILIDEDIKQHMIEFKENPTQELWSQILALKQEKEKLKESI